MTRQTLIVAALVTVLVLVLYYLFLLSPKMDEVGEIEDQISNVQQEQVTLRSRLAALEDVRARAPEIEAALAATDAVLPAVPNLPSALRQLQLAADESGARLVTVAPSRPQDDDTAEVAVIAMNVTLDGGYFQIVDFFRRVEDPSISPRAIRWDSVTLNVLEYPTLTVTATGSMFVVAPAEPAPASATQDQQQPGVVQEGQEDLEADIDAEVEDAA